VHVTLRVAHDLCPLRTKLKLRALKESMRATHGTRADFGVVHFSLQNSHVHLIVEAENTSALWRGIRALEIRLARRLNRLAGLRRGRAFGDRYHARALKTPREVRRALAYVLLNARHHAARPGAALLDPCSSGVAFDGWSKRAALPPGTPLDRAPPTLRAKTWLLGVGWRRHGLISPDEVPGPQRPEI
jgi:hypothetical protein